MDEEYKIKFRDGQFVMTSEEIGVVVGDVIGNVQSVVVDFGQHKWVFDQSEVEAFDMLAALRSTEDQLYSLTEKYKKLRKECDLLKKEITTQRDKAWRNYRYAAEEGLSFQAEDEYKEYSRLDFILLDFVIKTNKEES